MLHFISKKTKYICEGTKRWFLQTRSSFSIIRLTIFDKQTHIYVYLRRFSWKGQENKGKCIHIVQILARLDASYRTNNCLAPFGTFAEDVSKTLCDWKSNWTCDIWWPSSYFLSTKMTHLFKAGSPPTHNGEISWRWNRVHYTITE